MINGFATDLIAMRNKRANDSWLAIKLPIIYNKPTAFAHIVSDKDLMTQLNVIASIFVHAARVWRFYAIDSRREEKQTQNLFAAYDLWGFIVFCRMKIDQFSRHRASLMSAEKTLAFFNVSNRCRWFINTDEQKKKQKTKVFSPCDTINASINGWADELMTFRREVFFT